MIEVKEKALEIFNEHYFYLRANLMHDEEAKEDAIVCALITVNRTWKELENERVFEMYDYWQDVKNEIENIRNSNERQIHHK